MNSKLRIPLCWKEALAPLLSARIRGEKSPYEPLAIIMLATCRLRMGEFEKVRTLVAKERSSLGTQPYSAISIFLDSYAQFQQAKLADSPRRESAELLNALWNQSDLEVLGSLGFLIYAQAYADLGFYDQAEQMLRKGVLDQQTPLHDCIEYHLAILLQQKGKFEEAREVLAKIEERSDTYRKLAGHQLASLDLQENRFKECIRRCKALWDARPAADPVALMQIWGAAYEGLGDLKKASQCYAGTAPE